MLIPGKWEVRKCERTYVYSVDKNGEDLVVARVWGYEDMGDETAHLIAAAPELLAALKEAKSELVALYEDAYPDDESDNETTAVIDMVAAAIAKAEGRGVNATP